MKKGFLFSIDALLAIGITITLFAGITLVSLSGPGDGPSQAMLYVKGSDKALVKFLDNDYNVTFAQTTTKVKAFCKEIFDYNFTNSNVRSRVKKCEELK